MKKLLVLLLFCSIFVLGCNKSTDNEFEFEEFEAVENTTGDTNNEENVDVGEYNQQEQINDENNDVINELSNKGMDLRNAGKFDEAIETYTKAIEIDGKNANLYADRGRVKRDLGNIDGAIEDENKALELSQEGWIYAERAVSYNAKGDKELALKDFKKALSLDSSMDWVKNNIEELEKN